MFIMRFPMLFVPFLGNKCLGRDVKIVTTLHGTDITVLGYDPSLTGAIRFGIEKSDVVTAVSSALVNQTNDLIQPDKEIQTVYNFIDEGYTVKWIPDILKRNMDSKDMKKSSFMYPIFAE